jgi:hypothetical protein
MRAPLAVAVVLLVSSCASTRIDGLTALEGRWGRTEAACASALDPGALSIADDEIIVGGESCFIKDVAEDGPALRAIGICAAPDGVQTTTRDLRISRLGGGALLVKRDGERELVYRKCGADRA